MNKTILPALLLCMILSVESAGQTVINHSTVSGSWGIANSPYLVYGNITVPADSTLTIDPGVSVVFQGFFKIVVKGRLVAEGTEADSIFFTINDTTGFADTSIVAGGWHGIRFQNAGSTNASTLQYCSLTFGKAVGTTEDRKGGAICMSGPSNLIIKNCLLNHNLAARSGGAVFCNAGSILDVENSTLVNNLAYHEGGAICSGVNCELSVESCLFAYNTAYHEIHDGTVVVKGGAGGGLYISDPQNNSSVVSRNYIYNNFSYSGGGIYENCAGTLISGNVICNNSTSGIMNGHSIGQGRYFNNTVCNNGPESGMTVCSPSLQLVNNILWGNENMFSPGTQVYKILPGALPSASFSDIENGFPGEGNINALPGFNLPTTAAGSTVSALGSDWSLINTSPCLNVGNPDTSGMFLPPLDILGNSRIYGHVIEMGACENQDVISGLETRASMDRAVVFPNPGKDYITVQAGNEYPTEGVCLVYNVFGELVREMSYERGTKLYIGDLPAGVYFGIIRFKTKCLQCRFVKANSHFK